MLVGVTPFMFTWVNEELFEFNKMLLVYGITLCMAITWLARISVEKAWRWQKTALDIPLLLFLLSQIASTVFSLDPHTSFFGYYTRFNGGLLSTITYITLYYGIIHNISPKNRSGLLAALLLSSAGVALYAIPEHFGHSMSCFLISGSFDTECWVQDVKTRIFGTFGQPNWLAAYSAQLVPVLVTSWILAALAKPKNKIVHVLFATLLILQLLTTLYTQSRSGILAFGLSLGLLAAGSVTRWLFRYNQPGAEMKSTALSIKIAFLAAGIGVLAMALNGTPFSPSLSSVVKPAETQQQTEQIAPTPAVVSGTVLDSGGTDSGEIRKIVWTGAVRVWQRYPLFGSGLETFAYSYYKDRPIEHNLVSEWDFLYNKAHNEFLNILATAGLVGLVTYVLVLAWTCITALKKLVHPATSVVDATLLIALVSGLLAVSVSNFFGFSTVMVQVLLFMYIALIAQISQQEKPVTIQSQPRLEALSSENYLLFSLLLVVGLFGLAWVHRIWLADTKFAHGKALLSAQQYLEGTKELQEAVSMVPNEALFHDDLSIGYGYLAISAATLGDATSSAQFANSALQYSDQALRLNPHHVSFYRTRTRLLIALGQLEPALLEEAAKALDMALTLAPTDAKLMYNLGIVRISQGKTDEGIKALEHAISMKSNYATARLRLAEQYSGIHQFDLAKAQYRYIIENIDPNDANSRQILSELEATTSADKR